MAKQDYASLVALAGQAVKSVSNPELKRVAFEKVLDDLLHRSSQPSAAPQPRPAAASKHTEAKRRAKAAHAGPQAYIGEMVEEGFFKAPKTMGQVKVELENRGHHIPLTSLSGPLQKLCQRRVLRRQKAKTKGSRQGFSYSKW